MENILPTIHIEGTEFIVEVLRGELQEKANPKNRMEIKDMLYVGHSYQFQYDITTKNIASLESFIHLTANPHIKDASIPNLTELDPGRIAQKHNRPIEYIKSKTDFELTIKPGSGLDLRWNKKILPILKIAGYPFFVDLSMNRLRPENDFKSKGIDLDQIREYYDRKAHAYIIPYNPKTHEFQEIDHLTITELPKEIIVIKFPHHQELDRVGWNVKYGFGPGHCINEKEFQMHFKALTLPWAETNIPNSIKLNLEENRLKMNSRPETEDQTNTAPQAKKGRRI